jgi:hypothetical protein
MFCVFRCFDISFVDLTFPNISVDLYVKLSLAGVEDGFARYFPL